MQDAARFDNVAKLDTLNVTIANPECAVWWAHAWVTDSSSRQRFMTATHNIYLRSPSSIKKPYFSLANGILHIYSTEEELVTMVQCLCPYFTVTIAVYCLRNSENVIIKFPEAQAILYTADQITQGNPFVDLIKNPGLLRITCNPSVVVTNIHKNSTYMFGPWVPTPIAHQLNKQLSALCKRGVVCKKSVWIDIPLPDCVLHVILKVFPQVKSLLVIASGAKPHIPGVVVRVFDPTTRQIC